MNIIMSRAAQHQYPHRFAPQFPPGTTPTNSSSAGTSKANYPQPATPLASPLDFTDRIPFHELELSDETLGSGSYGTVYKGYWRGRNVAVKQFRTREERESFLVEVKQLSCVKNPNIVTLYGASMLPTTAFLIMEYAEGGSLNRLLHESKQQQYDLRHACSWAMQTARGVAYLHEMRPKPIMHRDLKPANLLLFSRGKVLKICDFGTACTVKTQMTSNTGSAAYMAPEVFATSSYLESGDVFSWSIIFWEILARTRPYSHQYSNVWQILWRVTQEETRPNELENCPRIIWSLITKCWHRDPKERPSMRRVAKEMEFIFSLTEKPTSGRSTPTATTAQASSSRGRNSRSYRSPLKPHPPSLCRPNYDQNEIQVHRNLHHLPIFGDMRDTLNSHSPDEEEKRELTNRSRALNHRLYILRRRAEELEESLKCDNRKYTAFDLLEEFNVLKRETELKKKELTQKKSGTFHGRIHGDNTQQASVGRANINLLLDSDQLDELYRTDK